MTYLQYLSRSLSLTLLFWGTHVQPPRMNGCMTVAVIIVTLMLVLCSLEQGPPVGTRSSSVESASLTAESHFQWMSYSYLSLGVLIIIKRTEGQKRKQQGGTAHPR